MRRLTDGERDVIREQERDARETEDLPREPPDCPLCRGTGIGQTPDSLCTWCRGTGVDDTTFEETDE